MGRMASIVRLSAFATMAIRTIRKAIQYRCVENIQFG